MMAKRNPHTGSSLDSLLARKRLKQATPDLVLTKAIALELNAAMLGKNMTKVELARLAGTSRSQLDRILSGFTAASMESIERVANVLGKRLVVALEDLPRKPGDRAKAPTPRLVASRQGKAPGTVQARAGSR